MANEPCQADCLERASAPKPRALDLVLRGVEHARLHGVAPTAAKALRLVVPARKKIPAPLGQTSFIEVLKLQPGETVEIKSVADIRATLDSEGKLRGLVFQPDMERFCGKQFQVFKRLETLYQEDKGRTRQVKNTVLLEGVYCSGLLMRCDRSCFHFWREAWLRRVPKTD